MKKIFKIASYDFKRLVFNPITLAGFVVVLVACMIGGFIYDIPTTPAYSASISGATAREVYTEFFSDSATSDTKSKLDKILENSNTYLEVQKSCFDFDDLKSINSQFAEILTQLRLYKETPNGSCKYIENGNIDEIKTASNELVYFVNKFNSLQELHSNLVFTNKQFSSLQGIAEFFNQQAYSHASIANILTNLYENRQHFDTLDNIVEEAERETWLVSTDKLIEFENLIKVGKEKLAIIIQEMHTLYENIGTQDKAKANEMRSLVTNYKLTCESVNTSIEFQLKILLENHFGDMKNLYGYKDFSSEEYNLALTKINFFLQDENPYYSQHQTALNFNSASYEVTLYDFCWFILSITGLMVILFGIFCAYKLFGRDRKNGKMDIILSQNVTFSQVFAGKFLAIAFSTSFLLLAFMLLSLLWGWLFYANLPGTILAVFNLHTVYTVHPFLFLLLKLIGIELQAIFYATMTLFVMNLSRKFSINFVASFAIFAAATVCNIFLNGSIVYCLFPFIHADLTSFLGGATMQTGFLRTALYTNGNFFISLIYYLVVVVLLYNLTKNMFKKN